MSFNQHARTGFSLPKDKYNESRPEMGPSPKPLAKREEYHKVTITTMRLEDGTTRVFNHGVITHVPTAPSEKREFYRAPEPHGGMF